MYNKEKFRELTVRIIAAEKEGFWSDYTDFERQEYLSKDWERFSRARGYTEVQIEEFREFVKMIHEAQLEGFNPYVDILDLTTQGALCNMLKDRNNEILKTSDIFF